MHTDEPLHLSDTGAQADEEIVTLADLRESNHPALQRIAERAAKNMMSSAYTSHNSHHSAHND